MHTVEKVGGTSMTRFDELLDNIIIADKKDNEFYNRIFVVSAYGGITNLLLENKKDGSPGVYAYFAKDGEWEGALDKTLEKMIEINHGFEKLGLDVEKADKFIKERINGVRSSLIDLMRLRSFGHFNPSDYLPACREFLSAVGEAHSAYNSTLILQSKNINAHFADLTGWREFKVQPLDDMISQSFEGINFSTTLPIATGYVKCEEGIMNSFDRGYSEITFSKIAVLTKASEGIIHKEFHLCTGDPKLMGLENVKIIGNTNFDIADQLADMDMEAIHSKASKEMELSDIPIRVKNAFDPKHPGTLISKNYVSPEPRVEMICGRDDLIAVELFDPEMVGSIGYDYKILKIFKNFNISYIAKNTNANTITHFISEKTDNLNGLKEALSKEFKGAKLGIDKIAIVEVIGSNMKIPGFLSRASKALAESKINILGLDQCMRQVNIQFIVNRKDFEKAQLVLHQEFV